MQRHSDSLCLIATVEEVAEGEVETEVGIKTTITIITMEEAEEEVATPEEVATKVAKAATVDTIIREEEDQGDLQEEETSKMTILQTIGTSIRISITPREEGAAAITKVVEAAVASNIVEVVEVAKDNLQALRHLISIMKKVGSTNTPKVATEDLEVGTEDSLEIQLQEEVDSSRIPPTTEVALNGSSKKMTTIQGPLHSE